MSEMDGGGIQLMGEGQMCIIKADKRTYTKVRSYIRTYIRTYLHTYIRTYIRTYIQTYIQPCIYIHAYIHTYIHTYTYIRTYIHTYIHTYIRTYIPRPVPCKQEGPRRRAAQGHRDKSPDLIDRVHLRHFKTYTVSNLTHTISTKNQPASMMTSVAARACHICCCLVASGRNAPL